MMEYKGYTGQITTVDEKQGLLHGRVAGITDVVTFEGTNFDELVQAFHDSVDDYLDFCAECKDAPEKPLSGKFLLRISPELHQQASLAAKRAGTSLNAWVAAAIEARIRHHGRKGGRGANGTEGEFENVDLNTLLGVVELRLLREFVNVVNKEVGRRQRLRNSDGTAAASG